MRIITIVFSTILVFTAVSAKASEFLTGFDDVPVMRGMAQVQSQDLVFDTPGGRIVEGYAAGSVTRTAVERFYRSTLPQLGWESLGNQEFSRDGERLRIGYTGQDGDLTVRFTLTPKK